MLYNCVRVSLSYQTNTFRQILKGITSIPFHQKERHSYMPFERRKYLYTMVTTSPYSVLKENPMGLPLIPSGHQYSPWFGKRLTWSNDISRCFSSATSGNGNNDNGDSPQDAPTGKLGTLTRIVLSPFYSAGEAINC